MQLVELNINGVNIDFQDQPDGLDKVTIGYDRDTPYNGFKVEAKATLTFYCGSGYNALKAEYDRAFVDGIGYAVISETCNGIDTEFKFNLDFSKYKQTTETIQLALVEDNPVGNLKDLLEVEKEIPEVDGVDVYVRNLDIDYFYHADKSIIKEIPYKEDGAAYGEDINFSFIGNLPIIFGCALNPRTETTINELEDGNTLTAETAQYLGTNDYIEITSGDRIEEIVGQPTTNPYPTSIFVSGLEPQEIFRNELEAGIIKIETNGSTALGITSVGGINFLGEILNFREIVVVGRKYETPRYTKVFQMSGNFVKTQNPLATGLTSIPLTNPSVPFAMNSFELAIEKGDSVWIQYSFDLRVVWNPPRVYLTWQYDDIGIDINRTIDIQYTTNKNTNTGVFNNMTEAEAGSTKISAYKASLIANELFPNIDYNELEEPKYNDLYITRGDILRNKSERDKFKLTPSKFFENLEKMSGLGLGVFYDNSLNLSYRLAVIEDFYTNNIFQTYSLEYDDVTISIAENMLYKAVEIGYNDFKETFEELHGKNVYQIEGVQKGKSTYSKICEWIASKYIIKKAINLGTSSDAKEYDKNLFIFSIDSNGATISDNDPTATIGVDLVYEQNTANTRGMNRKYSSLYNLKRHEYKWAFGLHKGKTNLDTQKNANNTKEISYDDGLGYIDLPTFASASNDITINDIDVEDKFVPQYIEFSVPMSINEFSNLRKNWYDAIQVNVDNDMYFGNIVSADWSEGICKYKLIGRIL